MSSTNNLGQVVMMMMVIGFVVIAVAIGVYALFLVNLKRLLDEISIENRQVPSNNVFLMFIPVFGLVYGFILFPKISESIRLEYGSRNRMMPGDGLKALGMTLAILFVVSAVTGQLADLGGFIRIGKQLGGLINLAALVIWIIYWVKSAAIKNDLKTGASNRADLLD